jgi:hypothetical protein
MSLLVDYTVFILSSSGGSTSCTIYATAKNIGSYHLKNNHDGHLWLDAANNQQPNS